MNLSQKVIVITGASKGLGAEMARILRLRGAQVVASARDAKALDEVAVSTGAAACVADVTKQDDMERLVTFTEKTYGNIDIWINNAGIWMPRTPFEEIDLTKRAHDLIEVNLFGTMYGCKAILPRMKSVKKGVIVNIVSTSALSGRPYQTLYSTSKHAVKGFTDSLIEELKQQSSPVMVIGVYPGGIKTHLFDEKRPDDYDSFMDASSVAEKIVANLEKDAPDTELIIKRPGQGGK